MKTKTAYHATWQNLVDSILTDGLVPGPDGCVYLAGPEPAHAAQFKAFSPQMDGLREVVIDGERTVLPNVIENKFIYVLSIDMDRLDPDLLSASSDHAPQFYHEDTESYCYEGTIPADCINLTHQIDMEAINAA